MCACRGKRCSYIPGDMHVLVCVRVCVRAYVHISMRTCVRVPTSFERALSVCGRRTGRYE